MADLRVSIHGEDRSKEAFASLQTNAERSESKFRKLLEVWSRGITIATGVVRAFKGISASLNATFEAAKRQQDAEIKLAGALANSSRNAEESFKLLRSWAAERQKVTTFGDEMTLELASMGAAFGLSAEQIKRATSAIQDWATLTGRSAEEGMLALVRAATGLGGRVESLGVSVDRTLGPMEQFESIVGQLERKYGGLSEAIAQTPLGKLTQLKNVIGDTAEKFGELLASSKTFQVIVAALNRFNEALQKALSGDLQPFTDMVSKIDELAVSLLRAGAAALRFFGSLVEAGGPILIKIGALLDWVVNKTVGFTDKMSKALSDAADQTGNASSAFNVLAAEISGIADAIQGTAKGPVPVLDDALQKLWAKQRQAAEEAKTTFEQLEEGMYRFGDTTVTVLQGLGEQWTAVFQQFLVDAITTADSATELWRNLGRNMTQTLTQQMTGAALQPIEAAFNQLANVIALPFRAVGTAIAQRIVQPIVDKVTDVFVAILEWLEILEAKQVADEARAATLTAAAAAQALVVGKAWTAAVFGAATGTVGAATAAGTAAVAQHQAWLAASVALEEGGIVFPKSGQDGVLTVLAEREPEIVMPVNRLREIIGSATDGAGDGRGLSLAVTIGSVHAADERSGEKVAQQISEAVAREVRGLLAGGRSRL